MSAARDVLGGHLLVPVIVSDEPAHATGLARALAAGGLPLAEVTLREHRALEVLQAMAAGSADVTVGAGTVVSADQVDSAVDAGARFLVSPGLAVDVVERARARGVPILPGVATPTDLMSATALGLDLVKLFPAGPLGGPAVVQALAAPFPAMAFVPTGGVGPDDVEAYLAVQAVAAVGGSWMVPAAAVASGDHETVRRLTADAVRTARAARPSPDHNRSDER
jgi:2-dehydro-3-deoxyphosphogluconate aldolase/(4S)-4-hydroxy-2-oxoglutarate aldolase